MIRDAPPAGEVFPQAVLDLLDTGGDRPVMEHGDRVVSAAEMAALVRRTAAGLRAAGIGPAVGVGMTTRVRPEAFAAMIAAFALGARVAGIRPGLSAEQLRHLLSHDITLVVDDERLDALAATADDERPLTAAGRAGDAAQIVYTSGSTGDPKGCVYTYAALTAAWAACPDRWPPAVRELAAGLGRYLIFGTLSSQVMLEYGLMTLAAGGTMVVADPPAFPDAIVRHRATASVITVPRLYQLARDQRANPVDLSSLRALLVSGSPLAPARWHEALDVLGPVVFQGYGQTEIGLITMATPAEAAIAPGSVGRPPAVTSLEIRDASGRALPPGSAGELFVRTPAQGSAYWADDAETREVFTDGWVRTRDLARLDGAGRVHLLGRARDVIIVNANLLYAGPIEQALASHPGVGEAYVVGAPDEDTGEAVHAFVVPARPGPPPDADELRTLVVERLGPTAEPRTLTVIDRVPTAPSGKPDKTALTVP